MKSRWKRALLMLLAFSLCCPFTAQGQSGDADRPVAELSGEDAESNAAKGPGEDADGDSAKWQGEDTDGNRPEQSGEDAAGYEEEQADGQTALDVAECADADCCVTEELPQYGESFSCLMGEWRVLRLTNKERVKNGLDPMSTSVKLQEACNIRKKELKRKFDHVRPDGRHCQTALTDVGLSINTSGENIAAGQTSSAEVVRDWINSEGHRYNILYPDFTHMGAGYERDSASAYGYYWVQVFCGKCETTGIALKDMGVLTVEEGTSIDEMDLVLEATCKHGTSFLPLMDEMCSGYQARGNNQVQTVTVYYRGHSTRFQVKTVAPAKPTQPTNPTQPTKPVQPTNPTQSTKPVQPTNPTQPTKPVQPTNPTQSTKPVQPTNPPQGEKTASVHYATHVQGYGWQTSRTNGGTSGTVGQSKRLEAIRIELADQEVRGNVEYRTHVQSLGWEKRWAKNGEISGSVGKAKRLEAIQIRLTGQMAEKYDIYYRVHAQGYGWLGWAKNGSPAGTAGYSKRLEGIQILLRRKGGREPGSSFGAYRHSLIQYTTHVQSYGWQANVKDGSMSGTSGQSKRLEGIRIQLCDQDYAGNVEYRTHVQSYGWEKGWVKNGGVSGTTGQAKRLEAIQIRLTGEMAEKYDIYYQVHAQSYGWLGWAKNGAPAGTAGLGKRLEGIRIRLVAKGGSAPGSTQKTYIQKKGI